MNATNPYITANNQTINLVPATETMLLTLVGTVYLFLNRLNGKVYVGQTERTFIERYHSTKRDMWHKYATNEHFAGALRKHYQFFDVFIMNSGILDTSKLDGLEIDYIKMFNSTNRQFGYNKHPGGNFYHKAPEKISNNRNQQRKQSFQKFLDRAKLIHNDKYDYSLVTFNSFKNVDTCVSIICKSCGKTFKQTPYCHLTGHGCRDCGIKNRSINATLTFDKFVIKANNKRSNNYLYELLPNQIYEGKNTKIKIIHKACGTVFYQTSQKHLASRCKEPCPKCRRNNIINKKSIPVLQICVETGSIVEKFKNRKEIISKFGFDPWYHIRTGKPKYGFYWKYKDST